MAAVPADRNLLFGLLALQNGLINQGQLVAAFQAWTLDKARALADHLIALGHLNASQRAAVEVMAELHVAKHGDVEHSLAVLPAGRSTRESLAQLGDPDIEGTLAHVRSRSTHEDGEADADRTASYAVGTATSDGQRFRVLRPHAKGGLGAVFVALDTELHREVALKQILDDHADDPESRQRFLLEAEITGGLEHPGIVPIYGLGTYGDGRPYYAMRFIKGDPLKQAIERFHTDERLQKDPSRRSLELRKLLRRFLDVCNAIEYAHSRGVLHRDIKPGNIIVGRHGETLVVDWGLAKATGKSDPSAGERTLLPSSASGSAETLPGSALGTPAYMSPEQAEGNLEHLGPRSDVYSLGATLYCLLTGQPPFAGEAVDVIPAVQKGEFRPPRAIDPTIDRALEAVCLQAMALKPEDRYGSPRALAEDIERWMADEPVSAWREPLSRQARRWARRNRTAVTGAAVALVAAVVGLGAVAGVQARANTALREANEATTQALIQVQDEQAKTQAALIQVQAEQAKTQAALTRATEEQQKAKQSASESKVVLEFFQEKVLAAARPKDQEGGLGMDATIRAAVDAAEPKIAEAFRDQPAAEASIRAALGLTYYYLGEPALAIRQHERSRQARRDLLGPDHPDTLDTMSKLAVAYRDAGRLADALPLFEETLRLTKDKLGHDHPGTLTSMNNLAMGYRDTGRLAEAVPLHEESLRVTRSKLGPDHPETLSTMNNLAVTYRFAGRLSEALPLLEETLHLRKIKLGPDHPNTLTTMHNLAVTYRFAGRLGEAVSLSEETLKLSRAKLGLDHPRTLTTMQTLAGAYGDAGRLNDAMPLNEEALKLRKAKLGPDHPDTLQSMNNLAVAYRDAGRLNDALSLFEESLKGCKAKLGPDHPNTLLTLNNLAGAYLAASRWSEAEWTARDCLDHRAKKQPDDWWRFHTMSQLGDALAGQNKYAEAEPLLLRGYEGLKAHAAKIPGRSKKSLTEAAERVMKLYEAWGKPDQAAAWKAKLGMSDLPADVFARP
jgi:serine/threonine protein kinase/tetratricopeptide (TPR) repeat protein